jgi:hypothetical protein
VAGWSDALRTYSPGPEVQSAIRSLVSRFQYRLDTNFAKIDRVEHVGLEAFKLRTLATAFHGQTILQWAQSFARRPEEAAARVMALAQAAPD